MPGISHDQPYIQVVISRTDHNDRVVYIPMKANGIIYAIYRKFYNRQVWG